MKFEKASECWLCDDFFETPLPPFGGKVRDHCPLTGKYGGAALSDCNLKAKQPEFVPLMFHNLSNCDSHLFFSYITGNEEKGDQI